MPFWVEAVETPDLLRERSNSYPDPTSAALAWAENVWVLFEEEVSAFGYGLLRDYSPEDITWVG